MTREELIAKIQDIEWDDFEAKEALNELPKNMWDTVSAFSNTSGGWILCGVVQKGKKFEIQGVNNGEKIENDFLTTLRNKDKFNHIIQCRTDKITVDGKLVLAFYIPSSELKPIWYGSPKNTFIRSGSGDQRATDMEIAAMYRDQAFGTQSEKMVDGRTVADRMLRHLPRIGVISRHSILSSGQTSLMMTSSANILVLPVMACLPTRVC